MYIARGRFKKDTTKQYDYYIPDGYVGLYDLSSRMIGKKLCIEESDKLRAKVSTPYERNADFYIDQIFHEDNYSHRANKFLDSVFLPDTFLRDLDFEVGKKEAAEESVVVDLDKADVWHSLDEKPFGYINISHMKPTNTTVQPKGENKMKKMFKNIKGFDNIGMVEDVFGMSLISQKMAVKVGDSFFSYDPDSHAIKDESVMVMELPIPAMVLPAKVDELKEGDIIVHDNKYAFVRETDGDTITLIATDGEQKTKTLVKNALMGDMNFVERLTSPFGDMIGTTEGQGGMFANPMMMMAFMGDSDGDDKDMFKMMMMAQMMGGMTPNK